MAINTAELGAELRIAYEDEYYCWRKQMQDGPNDHNCTIFRVGYKEGQLPPLNSDMNETMTVHKYISEKEADNLLRTYCWLAVAKKACEFFK